MNNSDAWFMACGFGVAVLIFVVVLLLGAIGANFRRGHRDH